MEKFVFDVFQFASKLAVLEVAREQSFSPLKNASGAPSCTAETCRADLYNLHRHFLAAAGASFTNSNGDVLPLEKMGEAEAVEIHPLASYAGEVRVKRATDRKGRPGQARQRCVFLSLLFACSLHMLSGMQCGRRALLLS